MTKPYLVPAIKRAFDVLNLLAETENGYTLSHIHRELKLPLSSAATIMYTLESMGYVYRDDRNSSYVLGMKLLSLSRHLDKVDLVSRCHGLLTELVAESGLTGHIATARNDESVYIDRVEAHGLVQVSSYIGMAWPLHTSAVGKSLLAFMEPEALRQKLATLTLTRLTARTVTSKKQLEKQLETFQHLGYSYEIDEDVVGVGCVGAPVFGPNRTVLAAISVAGTTQQVSPATVPELGKLVRRYANLMSARVGGDL